MASKTIKKSVPKSRRKKAGPTMRVSVPPIQESMEDLSVEIRRSVGWRLKLALFQLETEGNRTTKKAFVEQSIVDALDAFDAERK